MTLFVVLYTLFLLLLFCAKMQYKLANELFRVDDGRELSRDQGKAGDYSAASTNYDTCINCAQL